MFDRTELRIAIAAVLAVAVLTGWLLHVVWARLGRSSKTAKGRLAVLSSRLLAAEEARDAALAERDAAEAAVAAADARAARAEAGREAVVEAARLRVEELEAALEAERSASPDAGGSVPRKAGAAAPTGRS